ncbi:hypothetical protein ACOTC8_10120 [Achromobacter xylosoxidans]|uniref:hypothetical protein n=1 Tax=Achromobacter TaxID=222 RepID=UPI0006AC2697|nr:MULTISPECIES: hypothetical protein [Achromobacter]AXA78100.1 hypothetical protein CE206_17370 [Achromobacter xylosoxidans]KOQ17742.1 hypothetical protein ABW34_29370 [Achromobacter xylosoxidans]KOQ18956.1 hypothetical protein ABW36_29115 [Achromobacter xylosoxidans]KOQ20563.1 hypothetical protein ABW35_23630 [Achromobacter xylosoxidans]KOQ36433.1 hypothetical protein ABW39_30100 [Achromobacter xylosoxidans]
MRVEERRIANDHQIQLYFTYYDRFWRLHKLLALRETLRERERLKGVLQDSYGEGYFDYDTVTYKNLTNGILADAMSEVVMYCEDYLGLLKFIREKLYFVKHTVSYSAGSIVNIASRLRQLSREQTERLFFLPPISTVAVSLARQDVDAMHSSLQQYSEGVKRLISKHESAVRFYERYRDAHSQYKHGLKLCLNGLGGKLSEEELRRRRSETSGSVFILQNKTSMGAAHAGSVMLPDISVDVIRRNIQTLFDDRNLLHLETLYSIDIDELISIGKDICQLLSTLVRNRVALIENKDRDWIEVLLPTANSERMTSMRYILPLCPGDARLDIEEYQMKL